jgi:hypothetical protein
MAFLGWTILILVIGLIGMCAAIGLLALAAAP